MEDVTLLLYLKDVEYGKRLLRFLVQKKNPGLHPELVTAKSEMEFRIGSEYRELVVLTDDPESCGGAGRKIVLSSKQDREQGRIFQFQKAEDIYRELLWQLKLETGKSNVSETGSDQDCQGVYAVFSPEAAAATELSVTLVQFMAERGKCLYLQVSGFPAYSAGEDGAGEESVPEGMGELLFMLEQEDFARKAEILCHPFGKADMLPPLAHFKDLLDCRPEDWQQFIRRLREECGYDSVVVEMGQVFEFFLDILEQADRILFLPAQGVMGRIQCSVFRRYCKTEGKQGMLSRIQYVRQPDDFAIMGGQWENVSLGELAADRQKMECMRNIWEGGMERDDFIVEDFG